MCIRDREPSQSLHQFIEYPVQIWVLAPLTSVYDWGLIICSSRKPVGKLGIWVHILQIMDIFLLSNIQLAHADVPQE